MTTEIAIEGQSGEAWLTKLPHLSAIARVIKVARAAIWHVETEGSGTTSVTTLNSTQVNYRHCILEREGKPVVDDKGKIVVICTPNGEPELRSYDEHCERLVHRYSLIKETSGQTRMEISHNLR